MAGFVALSAVDVIAALLTGGFRIARRERGLALLVREQDVVVVPEAGSVAREKLLSLLGRAGVTEQELLSWLAAPTPAARTRSGFHRKAPGQATPGQPRSLEELVKHATSACARATAAHEEAQTALASSRDAIANLPAIRKEDGERLRAVRTVIDRWHEALREIAVEEEREKRRRR